MRIQAQVVLPFIGFPAHTISALRPYRSADWMCWCHPFQAGWQLRLGTMVSEEKEFKSRSQELNTSSSHMEHRYTSRLFVVYLKYKYLPEHLVFYLAILVVASLENEKRWKLP